jgi:hypothetical protein
MVPEFYLKDDVVLDGFLAYDQEQEMYEAIDEKSLT